MKIDIDGLKNALRKMGLVEGAASRKEGKERDIEEIDLRIPDTPKDKNGDEAGSEYGLDAMGGGYKSTHRESSGIIGERKR